MSGTQDQGVLPSGEQATQDFGTVNLPSQPQQPQSTLQMIRQKYPQYSDLSDEQVMRGMYQKYYSDMPMDQFEKRTGFQFPTMTSRAENALSAAASDNAAIRNDVMAPVGRGAEALGRGLERGAVTGTGQAVSGVGEALQGAVRKNTSNALSAFDQIDKGQMPQGDIPEALRGEIGNYINANPEQRQQIRQKLVQDAQDASKPGMIERAGQAVTGYGQSIPAPTTALGKAGQMVGSLAPVVGSAVVGGPVGALLTMAGQSFDDTYKDALSKGASQDEADHAATLSAITQSGAMAVPMGQVLDFVPAPLKDGFIKTAINMAKHGVNFAGFNSLAQLAKNYVAKYTYNPNQPIGQGVVQAGEQGLLTGMLIPATGAAARAVGQGARDIAGNVADRVAARASGVSPDQARAFYSNAGKGEPQPGGPTGVRPENQQPWAAPSEQIAGPQPGTKPPLGGTEPPTQAPISPTGKPQTVEAAILEEEAEGQHPQAPPAAPPAPAAPQQPVPVPGGQGLVRNPDGSVGTPNAGGLGARPALPAPQPPREPRTPTPRENTAQTPAVIHQPGPQPLGLPAPQPPAQPRTPTPRANTAQTPPVINMPGPLPPETEVGSPEWEAKLRGQQPPAPPAEQPPAETAPPEHRIADLVASHLQNSDEPISAKDLQRWGDHTFGGSLAEGKYSRDQLYDAGELGMNRYVQNNPKWIDPTKGADDAKTVADDLAVRKMQMPTQTVRAGEKDTHQQFSTPPDYAYAAAWAANIGPTDHVLEPSAGVGGLAVMAQNAGAAAVHTNELSEKRRGMLAALNPTSINKEDASQLNGALPQEIKPSVVLMNPPFSATQRMGDKKVLGEGAQHVEQALKRLQPGGRLVAIVGRGMGPDAPAFRDWWKRIGAQYDVRANVGVGGKIYQKYGTSFGTRLLVIDKNTPSGRPLVKGEVETAADLIGKLKDVRDDRGSVEQVAGEPTGEAVASSGEGTTGPGPELPGTTGVVGTGQGEPERPEANPPEPAVPTRPGTEPGAVAGERPGEGNAGDEVLPGQPEPNAGAGNGEPVERTEPSEEPGGGGGGGDTGSVLPDGSGERSDPGVTEAPVDIIKAEEAVTEPDNRELTEAVFENYKPERMKIEGAKEHPGALVQSAAMASVKPPAPTHDLGLPPAVISKGLLSDAQLEAVLYAGQAHSDMLPSGKRRGFFIGDGTGVGKGREVSGIFLDNWTRGKHRGVWVSEKRQLVNDARRDWSGLGQNRDDVFEHAKVKPGDDIKQKKGILFTTYDTMKSAEKVKGSSAKGQTRVDQIVKWLGQDFDGVIAYDESHNMANSVDTRGARGVKKAAQKALAALELQNKLPKARVVYVSATGATEVQNLAYADRLGLWGEGTPFPTREQFVSKIQAGGVAAMELVARDMKAMGHYIARNLSYDGVEYDRVEHTLTDHQRFDYDALAEGWQTVLNNFNEWLKETGADQNSRAKSNVMSQFWGAHQRFFNQVITSMQMPAIIDGVEKDLKAGRQPVLQLVNTMEAAQTRALDKATAEGTDLEDLDLTPRDQLMRMIESTFPVQQYEEYIDDEGNAGSRPVVDSNDQPVLNPEAVKARDALLDKIGSIRVPDGPLDLILNHFGTNKVAEVTGRKERVVWGVDERGQRKKVKEQRGGQANIAEADEFQSGRKPILVFSQAGGTGRSYHADINSKSADNRRSHYLVQPGWRADAAVQGFGRTHRTNQKSAPIFHLVTTDLQGQRRFISSIARRLGQLGALTKGERRAADQGMFGMRDNLESEEARAALNQLFKDVYSGDAKNIDMDVLEKQMGLKLRNPDGTLKQDLPEMSQFLNRMLSLKIDMQNSVFDAFSERLDDIIQRAAAAGTLDTGVETYKADKLQKVAEQVVYTDRRSGAETRHVQLAALHKNKPDKFEAVVAGRAKTGGRIPSHFVQNNRSGRVYAVSAATSHTDKTGRVIEQQRLTSPLDYQFIDKEKMTPDRFTRVDTTAAKKLWDNQVANTPEFSKSDVHLITGAVLPIWDRLDGKPKIYRLQTDDGERMLGRVIPPDAVNGTLQKLGAGQGAKVSQEPSELIDRVMQGATLHLANGWKISRRMVAGEPRMEITGPSYYHKNELENAGAFSERIQYETRHFLPTGDNAEESLGKIIANHPVASITEKGEGEGGSLYSFPGPLLDPQAWRGALSPLRKWLNKPQPENELLRDQAGLRKLMFDVRRGVAPSSIRGAQGMENNLRLFNAETAQAIDRSYEALRRVRDAIDQMPTEAQIEFTHKMEMGEPLPPELQPVADELRRQLDQWKRNVQSLGKGYLQNAFDNYMGHIWSNYKEWAQKNGALNLAPEEGETEAEALRRAKGRVNAKNPLWGSRAFLKERTFATQLDGINAGLKPVTYNPVDLQLIKIREMQRLYYAHQLFNRLKATGIAQWVPAGAEGRAMATGMVKLEDPIFQPRLMGDANPAPFGRLEPGNYFAVEPAARVFNNFMSRSAFNQSALYSGLRSVNNALNMAQLGLSGFHATFVLLDTMHSKMALALQQAMRSQFKAAAGSLASVPIAPIQAYRHGRQLEKGWYGTGSVTDETQKLVHMLKLGGGRVRMPAIYRVGELGSFFRSMEDWAKHPTEPLTEIRQMWRDMGYPPGTNPTAQQHMEVALRRAVALPLKIVGRTLTTIMQPLMDHLVPIMKLGVFHDLASDWMDRNPDASTEDMANASKQFVDSVDNRLGQLNYDNVFWNRTAKDIAFVGTRSFGWNLGSVREIGGGGVDWARWARDIVAGRKPDVTTRMAYPIAMLMGTAAIGALLTWAFTGKGPQSWKDYYFPNGMTIPGYAKDLFEAYQNPGQTALNKLSPLISMLSAIYQNKDFYGNEIQNPAYDAMGQGYINYLANEIMPFSLQSMMREQKEGDTPAQQLMSWFGFQKAPAWVTHPEKEQHWQQKQNIRQFKSREREPGRVEVWPH